MLEPRKYYREVVEKVHGARDRINILLIWSAVDLCTNIDPKPKHPAENVETIAPSRRKTTTTKERRDCVVRRSDTTRRRRRMATPLVKTTDRHGADQMPRARVLIKIVFTQKSVRVLKTSPESARSKLRTIHTRGQEIRGQR